VLLAGMVVPLSVVVLLDVSVEKDPAPTTTSPVDVNLPT